MPTTEDLRAAAEGIAYRCDQLALVAMMAGQSIKVDVQPPPFDGPNSHAPHLGALNVVQLVSNAFVETALVHSRALAYFLAGTKSEVKAADYEQYTATTGQNLVDDGLAGFVRSHVYSPVSAHVAHSKYASDLKNAPGQHPGRWPIPELAVVLVGGVAQAVARLDAVASSWFAPSPVELARMIEYRRSYRTEPSEHRDVRRLTEALAARLDATGTTT